MWQCGIYSNHKLEHIVPDTLQCCMGQYQLLDNSARMGLSPGVHYTEDGKQGSVVKFIGPGVSDGKMRDNVAEAGAA